MELNREDVIEALKCCSKGTATACYDCPYHKDDDFFNSYENIVKCMEKRMRDAVAVIEELTEKVECLETEKEHLDLVVEGKMKRIRALDKMVLKLTDKFKGLEAHLDVSVAEQARLAEKSENLHASCTALTRKCASLRVDTVREIQTRFAMGFGTYTPDETVTVSDVFRLLDRITNEMLEETR